jgi:hypothetical protein
VLALLALITLLAAAPSWNDTTCDRTTPVPGGWDESPGTAGSSRTSIADWSPASIPIN